MQEGNKNDETLFSLELKTTSILGEFSLDKFVQNYFGTIKKINENFEGSNIGSINFKSILIGAALNEGIPAEQIFDTDDRTLEVGKRIFNFATNELKPEIEDFYQAVHISDFYLIEKVELNENFRGQGIIFDLIKELYTRFSGIPCLIIVPLLPPFIRPYNTANDLEKTFYKLKGFFKNLGFDHIDGFEEFMFLNPENRNEVLS